LVGRALAECVKTRNGARVVARVDRMVVCYRRELSFLLHFYFSKMAQSTYSWTKTFFVAGKCVGTFQPGWSSAHGL